MITVAKARKILKTHLRDAPDSHIQQLINYLRELAQLEHDILKSRKTINEKGNHLHQNFN